jgi:hypothetical protein
MIESYAGLSVLFMKALAPPAELLYYAYAERLPWPSLRFSGCGTLEVASENTRFKVNICNS